MNKIAVLGANPAWQKTLSFTDFGCSKVNRAVSVEQFASGKGINFCRAVRSAGTADVILMQFAGGENGRKLITALDELGIEHATAHTCTETRCCITILNRADNSTTECIEPSYTVTEAEINDLTAQAEKIIPQCRAVAICGTLPGDTDGKVYFYITEIAAKYGIPVLVDACKNIEWIWQSDAEINLKINKDELFSLSGKSEITEAFKHLFELHGSLKTVAVTDGPDTAFASDGKNIVSYRLPELKNIVSTLGCGDTASAIYTSNLINEVDYILAFKKALAAASANCLSFLCGKFNPNDAVNIESKIKVDLRKI